MIGFFIAAALAAPPAPLCPAEDIHRFPPAEYVQAQCEFAECVLNNARIYQQIEPHRAAFWAEYVSQAAACSRAWEQLANAHTWDRWKEHLHPHNNCNPSLATLRETIGESFYAVGAMPPSCPWWLFRHID